MRKDMKGFTLIELLIVITIIGILTVLGARQFGNAIGRANAVADFSNAKSIDDAIRQAMMMKPGESISMTKTKIESTSASIGTQQIGTYLANIPAVKLQSGRAWYVDVNSATQSVTVYVAAATSPSDYIQLSPRMDDAYYNNGAGNSYKDAL